jgi:hypothetical protein
LTGRVVDASFFVHGLAFDDAQTTARMDAVRTDAQCGKDCKDGFDEHDPPF